jgi:HSP20 family molecular chaperone IbpA
MNSLEKLKNRMLKPYEVGDFPQRFHVGDFLPDNDPWWCIIPKSYFCTPTRTTTFDNLINPDRHYTNNEKEYSIEFKVPGLNKDDIEITLKDNILTVEYKKVEEENNPDKRYFAVKSFKESVSLPQECNLDTITSCYQDGILKVSMEKIAKEEPEIRKIEIK